MSTLGAEQRLLERLVYGKSKSDAQEVVGIGEEGRANGRIEARFKLLEGTRDAERVGDIGTKK